MWPSSFTSTSMISLLSARAWLLHNQTGDALGNSCLRGEDFQSVRSDGGAADEASRGRVRPALVHPGHPDLLARLVPAKRRSELVDGGDWQAVDGGDHRPLG